MPLEGTLNPELLSKDVELNLLAASFFSAMLSLLWGGRPINVCHPTLTKIIN